MQEPVQVSVDRDFARFGSKSYAINKINTVDVVFYHPHSRNAALVWGFLGVVVLLGMLGNGFNAAAMILVIALGSIAWWSWQRSKIVEYRLMLATSSGAVQAITSRDEEWMLGIRRRIEAAIAGKLD